MAVRVTWLGHAAVQIDTSAHSILIDPFLTDNPAAKVSADDVSADFIIISHGHGDHVGDALKIAQRCNATIISNYEIAEWCGKNGAPNVHPQHIGGAFHHPFGTLKLTIAHHGSMLPDGSYGGNPCGVLLSVEGKKIYDACDTGLFYDMKLIGEAGIDLALLPIGDNFTMGPEDALRAVQLVKPRRVVPIHYNTWPLIAQDPHAWAEQVRAQTESEPVVLEPGQSIDV
ncbi:MAG: metal-dependent hydrolase [Planctomycetota bacterium]|nr:MAG: metal-dependent hydrolase [Planctomycetota bacterium]